MANPDLERESRSTHNDRTDPDYPPPSRGMQRLNLGMVQPVRNCGRTCAELRRDPCGIAEGPVRNCGACLTLILLSVFSLKEGYGANPPSEE